MISNQREKLEQYVRSRRWKAPAHTFDQPSRNCVVHGTIWMERLTTNGEGAFLIRRAGDHYPTYDINGEPMFGFVLCATGELRPADGTLFGLWFPTISAAEEAATAIALVLGKSLPVFKAWELKHDDDKDVDPSAG